MQVSIILFEKFQDLDVFGPSAVLASIPSYEIAYFSQHGGPVKGSCGAQIQTSPISDVPAGGIVLIPGGFGTRAEVNNAEFIAMLKKVCEGAAFVLTVCTGSGLLAKTGLLDGRPATSNKLAFEWARKQGGAADWRRKARWVADGNIYTSSGVSAGIDMALGFVADRHGVDAARAVANGIEHIWNNDPDDDPFAV